MVPPKFIVDDMLGKLAVRLRMLGFDTTYYRETEDSLLLRKSKEENRILLTRDTHLVKVRQARALLITSIKLKEQLEEVIKKFKLKIKPAQMFSRCSVCNGPLKEVSKDLSGQEEIKEKIPPLVYQSFSEFSYCPACDKCYWKGTHYEKITEELGEFISL